MCYQEVRKLIASTQHGETEQLTRYPPGAFAFLLYPFLVRAFGSTWLMVALSSSMRFAAIVGRAMELKVQLVLAHEMPGFGQEERNACQFDQFFSCDRGATAAVGRGRRACACTGRRGTASTARRSGI